MSLSAANAVITLSIAGLFNAPQQLQGFAADDVFETDALESVEVLMGVDQKLSGGFVAAPLKQMFSLQSDSPSIFIFDQWWQAMKAAADTFQASGVIILTTVGTKWTMNNGFLTSYMPLPTTKKLIQPRKFQITWESGVSVPIAAT